MTRRVHVAAAVIRRGEKLFVARRPAHLHMGGLWEFPGGKVEAGETVQDALTRELAEELGIAVQASSRLIQVPYDYPDKSVLLDVWEVDRFDGEPLGLEGQETRWVETAELRTLEFPAANEPIVDAACLPAICAISREAESMSDWLADLQSGVERGLQLFVLRPPTGFEADLFQLASAVQSLPGAQQVQWQWHLNLFDDAQQARELLMQWSNFGLHLPAKALAENRNMEGVESKLISASCHSKAELYAAQVCGARFLLLSPIAPTKHYKGSALLGWAKFADWVAECQLPVYGLGGLSLNDTEVARMHGGQGVALQRSW